MIDAGVGLAVLGIGAPITAAIIKMVPPRNILNRDYIKKDLCKERSGGMKEDIKEIKATVNKIFDKLEARQ